MNADETRPTSQVRDLLRLATQLGFMDDVRYWQRILDERESAHVS